MSAARRKGKWDGGMPVLGYDVAPGGGRLIVNEKENRRVRDIFALFIQHRSLSAVVAELGQRHWKTKSWKSQNGTVYAGRDFAKASLRRLLTNAIYDGKVEHKGTIYTGEQPSIIEVKAGKPAIAITLLPWIDKPGNLDALIFDALSGSHSDLLNPIADYRTATAHRTKGWKVGSQAKMNLRCMIAASHEPDPGLSLAYLLEGSKCPVDFNHTCFDQLMSFFDDFKNKV